MILVVGGTGTLGRLVVRLLLASGERVRILTRRPFGAAALREAGAEILAGDLLDPDAVTLACAGAHTLVCVAHSMLGRGRHASDRVDGDAHRALIDAATEAGVRHVVYTSVHDYGPATHQVPFFRTKFQLERHLKGKGVSYTILRPTAFIETHAHMLIGAPILAGRRVVMIGNGENPRNFVAARDVATFAVLAIHDPALAGGTLDIGGPDNRSHMDVVRTYEQASGRRARVTHIPLAVARIARPTIQPIHPGVGQLLQAIVLAETTDQRFDAAPLARRFPQVPLTSLDEWIASTGHGSATLGEDIKERT